MSNINLPLGELVKATLPKSEFEQALELAEVKLKEDKLKALGLCQVDTKWLDWQKSIGEWKLPKAA